MSVLQTVYFNSFIGIHFYPIIWYNRTINLYFNFKRESSISVLLFYIIVPLPDDDCSYWLKHVIVSMMNTFVFS